MVSEAVPVRAARSESRANRDNYDRNTGRDGCLD
jgi:hypothetical protein